MQIYEIQISRGLDVIGTLRPGSYRGIRGSETWWRD